MLLVHPAVLYKIHIACKISTLLCVMVKHLLSTTCCCLKGQEGEGDAHIHLRPAAER